MSQFNFFTLRAVADPEPYRNVDAVHIDSSEGICFDAVHSARVYLCTVPQLCPHTFLLQDPIVTDPTLL